MKIVELIRLEENDKEGTFGILKIDKEVFCCTLEPPDMENQQNISSIPAQQYRVEPYSSDKYKKTFQVMRVPGRTKVLFHAGNTVNHTQGCIILGERFGKLKGATGEQRAVLNSGKTFQSFRDIIKLSFAREEIDYFHLTIREVF